jgi:hypothetical protein
MNKKEQERQTAIEDIRKYFNNPPRNPEKFREYMTVYTSLNHVSKSGMMRVIDVRIIRDNVPLRLSWTAADAIGTPYNRQHEGVQMGGCGMDMGFALVYNLSSALWPKGYMCDGPACRSNGHSNGDRDYTRKKSHWHSDGGYRLNHRWM